MRSNRFLSWGIGGLLLGCAACVPDVSQDRPLRAWGRFDTPLEYSATVSWRDAGRALGKTVAVEGKVVRAFNSGRACFLDFTENWKGTFQGVIFASNFGDYPRPPEELFLGRRVRLIGKIVEHRGTPEILIEDPRQIQVLEG